MSKNKKVLIHTNGLNITRQLIKGNIWRNVDGIYSKKGETLWNEENEMSNMCFNKKNYNVFYF